LEFLQRFYVPLRRRLAFDHVAKVFVSVVQMKTGWL